MEKVEGQMGLGCPQRQTLASPHKVTRSSKVVSAMWKHFCSPIRSGTVGIQ